MAQVRSQSGPGRAQTRTRNMIKKKNINMNVPGIQTTTENRIKNTTNPKSFSMNLNASANPSGMNAAVRNGVRDQYRKAFAKKGRITK